MSFRISYRTLLRVDILHHFFLNEGLTDFDSLSNEVQAIRMQEYRLGNFLAVVMDKTTSQSLAGGRMRLVATPTGFRIAIQVDDQNRPLVSLGDQPLYFGLIPTDSRFYNYSALRLGASFHSDPAKNNVRRISYFNNPPLGGGIPTDTFSLVDGIPAFVPGEDYFASDLCRFNSDVYEATQDIVNSANPNTGGSGWVQLTPDREYASPSDEIRFRPALFDYIFTAPGITAPLRVLDQNSNIVWERTVTSAADQLRFEVDLRKLSMGRYTLEVDNGGGYQESQDFFYAPEWYGTNIWGVIAIENTDLLSGAAQVLDRPFDLRIHNRRTRWRYLSKHDQTEQTVSGNNSPLPLTAHGRIDSVTLNSNVLPGADAGQILPDSADALIYSNIFIDEDLY